MVDNRSDNKLIENCLAGDAQAWAELVERYQRLVYSVAMRCGLSEQDADDTFQAVFVILLNKLETCRDRDYLGHWLTTITRREAWRVLRQRGARTDTSEALPEDHPAAQPPPSEALELLEEQALIRQAMDQLGDRCRRLLWHLFYRQEPLSYAEVAERLAMPEGSIGPTRARCLVRLRAILDSLGYQ